MLSALEYVESGGDWRVLNFRIKLLGEIRVVGSMVVYVRYIGRFQLTRSCKFFFSSLCNYYNNNYYCYYFISLSFVTGLSSPVLLTKLRWSPPLRLQVSHCSTFRIMCDVTSIVVFCTESIEYFPTMISKFFFKLFFLIFRLLQL